VVASYDFRAQRLFVVDDLAQGIEIVLPRDPSHYVLDVLRLGEGDPLLLFNGRDGEWLCRLVPGSRKAARLVAGECMRPQPPAPDLLLGFAPLKHARLDYMVQKAVEMGVCRLVPVITRHTQVSRVNRERMQAKTGRMDIDYAVLHDAFFTYVALLQLLRLSHALGALPTSRRWGV
jgi:16S rRNA (uracil1498-N3)-methyltransferase